MQNKKTYQYATFFCLQSVTFTVYEIIYFKFDRLEFKQQSPKNVKKV